MNDAERLSVLHAYFEPQVMKQLGRYANWIKSIETKFVEMMDVTNGIMFELNVEFESMTCYDLIPVATRLDEFCCNNDDDGDLSIEGYKYMLGDGDDSGAVRFEEGKFKIWLRGWKVT